MPKVKIKRKSTLIDMTAMSDVTVLLLTFFMLTSTFVQKEPVTVTTPSSVSEIKIPETNLLQVLIDKEGKIFLSLDNQKDREGTLKEMGREYNIEFTPEEINKFKVANSFGVPIREMKAFLALPAEKQEVVLVTKGIPNDSIDNQFQNWVLNAKRTNKDLEIAIKADHSTPYPMIKGVMSSLQGIKQDRYKLITSLKAVAAE